MNLYIVVKCWKGLMAKRYATTKVGGQYVNPATGTVSQQVKATTKIEGERVKLPISVEEFRRQARAAGATGEESPGELAAIESKIASAYVSKAPTTEMAAPVSSTKELEATKSSLEIGGIPRK